MGKPIENRNLIAAVVLAAGFSRRMGRFKPLLHLGKRRAIERVVDLFHNAGIEEIIVVTGHRGGEVDEAVAPLSVRCVENPEYHRGMFSSILTGVRALPQGCRGFFIHPADIALVRPQTVKQLVAGFQETAPAILYPAFLGERGHPTLINADLVPGILKWRGDGGLRPFLRKQEAASLDIAVADEAVLMDMDTAEEFKRMEQRLAEDGIPTEKECRALMETIQVPPPAVAAHCRAVAGLARQLATALRAAGTEIDTRLVYAAALLHDIARTEKNHADAGARLLEAHGFSRLAPIVRPHMDLKVREGRPVDEAQVVFLADKWVEGTRHVGLARRFAPPMEKYGGNPAIAAKIKRRLQHARRVQDRVERITGLSINEITEKTAGA